jgi:tetratricopeptide (TPR) repeat protein
MISKKMYFLGVFFCVSFIVWGVNIACAEELSVPAKQDELYKRALALKEDGNYDAAFEIFKKLASENPNDSKYEISYLDIILDQCITMKALNNSAWMTKAKEVGGKIKTLYTKYARNAEYYLVYAKYSWLVEAKREAHITKALEKSLYFKPNNPDAYILKGDIYLDQAKKADSVEQHDEALKGSSTTSRQSLAETAKTSYESALKSPDLSDRKKAYVYYKMGELESQIFGKKDIAKANWEKAAALAPDSKSGKSAREMLAK